MHQGLLFLWVVFAIVSFGSWTCRELAMWTKGRLANRRRITGCELARQVLDRLEGPQRAVLPSSSGFHADTASESLGLALSERVYHGSSLGELALALRETARAVAGSPVLFPIWARSVVRGLILLSWVMTVAGFCSPFLRWMAPWGEFLFMGLTLGAFARVTLDWEVSDRALRCLASVEGLGTDERVRMKEILEALRWSPLAELFIGSLAPQIYGVSKSKRIH